MEWLDLVRITSKRALKDVGGWLVTIILVIHLGISISYDMARMLNDFICKPAVPLWVQIPYGIFFLAVCFAIYLGFPLYCFGYLVGLCGGIRKIPSALPAYVRRYWDQNVIGYDLWTWTGSDGLPKMTITPQGALVNLESIPCTDRIPDYGYVTASPLGGWFNSTKIYQRRDYEIVLVG